MTVSHQSTDELCFPQRATINIEVPNPSTEAKQRQAGPWFFKDGENMHFMRAEKVKEVHYSESDSFLDVELESKLYINRTAQTHDSVMHQFIDGEGEPGTLWLRVYFFTEDIFRVQFSTERGALDELKEPPGFPPPEARMLTGERQSVKVNFEKLDTGAQLSSPNVRVHIQQSPFRVSATRQGENVPFWRQRLSDLFISDVIPASVTRHQGREATFESFQLSPGEAIFGLGERFDGVARRGRKVDFVNHDAIGTSNTRSYINVPFLWSTAGYGCFLNSAARAEWDVGMSDSGSLGLSMEEKYMDYFIISGKTPKSIMKRYTRDLTGDPVFPSIWSFGVWFSRNSYASWDVVDEVIKKCNEEKVPLDVIHLDTFWFKEDWNMDLLFDTERFGEPEKKIPKLLEDGIRVSLWQCTFVPPREDNVLYREGLKDGLFAFEKLSDGSKGSKFFEYPPGTSGWRTDDCIIDYSNPKTREWYAGKIKYLANLGVAAIKTDFGDCHPAEAYYNSVEGRRFQNTYTLAYNSTVSGAMKSVNEDTVVWARSGTAGSQRFPIHWGGDSQCSWTALQGSFNATLSMGLSGFPFFASDCGGFIGKPDPELYIRWAQLSLLAASHFRSHGAGNDNSREPWTFGTEALGIFKKFADLRYQLLPYTIEQGRKSCADGVGLVRHLILEWPEDRNTWNIETQCLLGEDLMIIPVTQSRSDLDEVMDVYFPKGKWYDFWTKKLFIDSAGEWKQAPTPALDSMALYVRGGASLCFAEKGRLRTHNEVGEVVKIECYGGPRDSGDSWSVGTGTDKVVNLQKGSDSKWSAGGDVSLVVESY